MTRESITVTPTNSDSLKAQPDSEKDYALNVQRLQRAINAGLASGAPSLLDMEDIKLKAKAKVGIIDKRS